MLTAETNRDAALRGLFHQTLTDGEPKHVKLGFTCFLFATQGCLWQLGTIYFYHGRQEKKEMNFVNAIKLRKIQNREKDGPGVTFPSMNPTCSRPPGSEV